MQRANRFFVKQIRFGVFPHFVLLDHETEGCEIDDGSDGEELQDVADAMNSIDRSWNGVAQ